MGQVLTSNFAKMSSGDSGYSASPVGLSAHASDIMARTYSSPSPSVENLYETNSLKAAFAQNDPVYGEEQSFTESLVAGNTRTQTLMDTMKPDTSYAAPKVNAGSMMRDANKVVTDGAKVSQQANMAMENTQESIASFQSDWKQAKHEALDALVDASKDMGIDPSVAADALIPDSAATKGAAMAYVAAELAIGGGTLATVGKAAFVSQELSEQEKKLPPEKQEALLKETMDRLQASSESNQDSRAKPDAGSVPADAPKQSDIAWENMEIDDLAEFLAADSDGLDQPEMQELLQMEHDLEVVLDNHDYVQEHYADVVTADKMFASAATGNEAMNTILLDASVVESRSVAATYDQGVDAASVALAGDSLAGVTMLASDARFDSSAVQTFLDVAKVDVPEVKRQLSADIEMQFSAGMG
ncbi:MAG: hypothetical protein ACRBCK_00160 [Alphaproteobacteria bacterium]